MPATADTAQREAELVRLLAELHARGIRYLSGGEDMTLTAAELLPPAELLRRLAACPEARVRNATIALLLLHPELADAVPDALVGSESAVAEALKTLVLATLYLQRLWETSLAVTIGHAPTLPESDFAWMWRQRRLPSPDEMHGELGLRHLQEAEQRRLGLPLNLLADWQDQVDHLMRQEWAWGRARQNRVNA
jgi:hypothetical protein